MDLCDKTFLVTGASRGIGYAVAKLLDAEEANLILVARNTDGLNLSRKHTRLNIDLTSNTDLTRLSAILANQPIDGLLNIAGVGIYQPLADLSREDLEISFKLNVIAPFLLTKYCLPSLIKSDLSLVLNIGSGAGVMPFKNRSAYCASKYALRGLTLSLAEEYPNGKPDFCLITLGSTITSFGGKSIPAETEALNQGKATFPVEWLADKLIEIIKDGQRETEIVLYPSEYGFGNWQKP